MSTSTLNAPAPPPISPTVRRLAGFAFVATVGFTLVLPVVMWRRHTPVALLHGLLVLPAVLWAGHRSWHTARATPLIDPYWPFASQRVLNGYWLISVVIALFASRLYQ